MERRVEFMILEFVGRVLLNVLKAMVWMALLMRKRTISSTLTNICRSHG